MSDLPAKPLTLRGLFYLSRELISKYGGDAKTNLIQPDEVTRPGPNFDEIHVDFITTESTRNNAVIKLCAEEILKEVKEQLKLKES